MSTAVTSSDDANSVTQERALVPPLFAGPLRDDLLTRIRECLEAGSSEKAAGLLEEAEHAFPIDDAFAALHSSYMKLCVRKSELDDALQEGLNELNDGRFAGSISKFSEALSLSAGIHALTQRAQETCADAALTQAYAHWRFADSLLQYVTSVGGEAAVPRSVESAIRGRQRDEVIRLALTESVEAEQSAYLPHVRNRLAELAKAYTDSEPLAERISALDRLWAQRLADEREKNLRRLQLFRERVQFTENPEALRRFPELTAPFATPYSDDAAFSGILDEMRGLGATYDNAAHALAKDETEETLKICESVLSKQPKNVLFCALEEKAKSREWALRLIKTVTQRARNFEEKGQYAEALEEWESLREIDPHYPGLEAEILHCAALKDRSEGVHTVEPVVVAEPALIPEILAPESEPQERTPVLFEAYQRRESVSHRHFRIAITTEAWNHLKTGLAAALAVLLIVLVFASKY